MDEAPEDLRAPSCAACKNTKAGRWEHILLPHKAGSPNFIPALLPTLLQTALM